MPRLVMRLLGAYRVELNGEPVYAFEADKARALLAYLAVEADRPHRRESLAGLLWPEQPESVARRALRHTLFRVRQAIGDQQASAPFLLITPTDVQFNTAADYVLDTAELEAFGRKVAESRAGYRQLLPLAFCGDFLAGFSVPDSEAFEAWVLTRQEHYHRLAIGILGQQNAYFEKAGDYEQAAAAARLQLQMEPWLEEAHRACMRALACAGRREEAVQQYEACRRVLQSDLGLEPAASTERLCADIRVGRLVAPGRGRSCPRPGSRPAGQPRGLPLLVARGYELGLLGGHLQAAMAGEAGVAFVSGDAGSGKTSLLETFAASAMAEHPDLLAAGARCSPGGRLDPLAPLRKLGEMLFGDLTSDVAWRLPGPEQVDRLQRATGLALAALTEHGAGLAGTLVGEAAIARRGGPPSAPKRTARAPAPPSQTALFDQLLCTLAAIARQQPLLLLFDDLHWVDDVTAAFLVHLGRELGGSRLLVLGAYRSATVALGRRDPVSGEATRHPLAAVINELRRAKGEIVVDLDRADGRAFVEAFVDIEPNRLGAPFRDALYGQTGGHALFTVEMLRNLQNRGELYQDEAGRWVARESLDWGSLPARVEAAIGERIDRLPAAERRILSVASVQGDDFAGEAVAELTRMPPLEVLACLSGSLARQHSLVKAEGIVRAEGQPPQPVRSIYRFTHHLFQKYLYDQLDPVERAQLHAAVAANLDRQAAGNPPERERLAERLAWHYEAGGLPLQAARALLDAGNQAIRVSAFREALGRYDHGLALLAKALLAGVPPSVELRQVQRLLEVARLAPERQLEGLGGAGLERALARAAEAWATPVSEASTGKLPTEETLARPKLMLLFTEMERLGATGEYENALAAAERLAEQAAQSGEEDFAAVAQLYFGIVQQTMGHPQESDNRIARALDSITPARRARLRAATGIDLLANALGFSAFNAWFLGRSDAALARSKQAIAFARADGATVGEAAAAALGAGLRFLLGGDRAPGSGGPEAGIMATDMAELAERCHRLCAQLGIYVWRVFAEVMLGRAMVMAGEDVAGIERMRGAGWQGGPMTLLTDFFTVVLANSCLLAARRRGGSGNPAERTAAERRTLLAAGLETIEGKLGPARIPCQQAYEAELHRLRGELLLARDGLAASEEALNCFQRGLQLGREQGALAWELRAAVSLVRLRERQGAIRATELAEARACLAEVYGRFTEGLDFPDLQEAAALIRETA